LAHLVELMKVTQNLKSGNLRGWSWIIVDSSGARLRYDFYLFK
jgi:hypothetical protein